MIKPYFSHDYASRLDEKIKLLIRKHGMVGYGVYWAIVEDLYINNNEITCDIPGISKDLRVKEIITASVLRDFLLFSEKNGKIYNATIQNRLEAVEAKSLKASHSANIRWHNENAIALPTQCDRIASKVKESKEKEIKESKVKYFTESLFFEFTNEYQQTELEKFAKYWCNFDGKNYRFETVKNWNTGDRLKAWVKKGATFTKPNTYNEQNEWAAAK